MFSLTHDPIDLLEVERAVTDTKNGALLLFVGVTRDHYKGRKVSELSYEAYPEMAIPSLEAIGKEAKRRWPGSKTAIVHRLGIVPHGEVSVVIGTSTPHRGDCYEANRFAIEELKRTVPIWKKEIYEDGSEWKANEPRPAVD